MTFIVSKIVLLCSAILLFSSSVAGQAIELSLEATYATGVFDEGAQEISVYSVCTGNIYATNSFNSTLDVLSYQSGNPSALTVVARIDLTPYDININSVDVAPGQLIAVAGTNSINSTAPGKVLFFREYGLEFLLEMEVGSLPDMVKFHKDKLIVCNEAEAADGIDPIGSISILQWELEPSVFTVRQKQILFSSLGKSANRLRREGVRIFPNKTVDEDCEPEYITVIDDKAYITLQEQNSIAVIDLETDKLLSITSLGYMALSGTGMDTNDGDKMYMPRNYSGIFGMFMPDTIKSFQGNNKVNYLVTANEGDSRTEVKRISALNLTVGAFDNATLIKSNDGAGRLEVSSIDGLNPMTGLYDSLYSYGTRSFSIWNADTMGLVFDSLNDFERITFNKYGPMFNSGHDCNDCGDGRSDNKGPEPEALAVGNINGYTYAFIGLERMCGIMVYDITEPKKSKFVTYYSNRDFSVDPESPEAGDLGPEGLEFIPAGTLAPYPMLLSSNEVSGTTSLYKITINRKKIIRRNKVPVCRNPPPF